MDLPRKMLRGRSFLRIKIRLLLPRHRGYGKIFLSFYAEKARKGISMGKFVIRTVNTGIKFDLKATNGQVILTSEVYTTKAACQNGVQSIMKNAPAANVEDQTVEGFETMTHPKFEMYQDKAGEYRFRLKARNGEIIGVSEGYTTKANCVNGVESVKKNAADAEIVEA